MDISDDVIFKRVFGMRANKDLLIALLNAVLDELDIRDLEYLSPETTGFDRNSKNSRMDLKCRLDNGMEVIVEVQVRNQHDFPDRAVYYAALPILEEIRSGDSSYKLTPRYVIAFLHFSLEHAPSVHWESEYRARYSLREQYTGEKLSEAINIVMVELGRFKKDIGSLDNDLERFYFCMKHMRELTERPESMESETMLRLFEVTDVESMCKKEREEYDRYMTTERDIRNQNAYEREMAMKEGIEKGLAEGRAEANREIAKMLLSKGMSKKDIAEVTGIPVSEI